MELFEQFVKERRYLKNVSPSTEQRYQYSWKALGRYLEPCFTAESNGVTGAAIREALLRGIEALHASNSPISINTLPALHSSVPELASALTKNDPLVLV